MPRRHRSHSTEFKRQVVAEYHAGETLHALGRRHDVSRNLIRIWIEKAEAGALDEDAAAAELLTDYEARIAALGQVSDYIGARALLGSLPDVEWLLGDRGYDADWFRDALKDKGIRACIPGRKQRKTKVKYDKRRYKRRNRIEIMFGRLKDWRRVATRYDRCPKVFLSAIALAATVIYWL